MEKLHEDPHGWVIGQVSGRGTPGGKGLAAAHSMTSRGPDGQQMSIERVTRGFCPAQCRLLLTAERLDFDRCPICLTSAPTSEEHVPPNSPGGTKMTLTCEVCNHLVGSRLEADLLDWWEDAYSLVRLEHDNVIGARRVARVLMRQTSTGEFALLADRPDPAISQAIAPDTKLSMHVRLPDPARWHLGAVKSAYLGSCLLTRSIPATPEADSVRADLLAARDGDRHAALVLSDHSQVISSGRTLSSSLRTRDGVKDGFDVVVGEVDVSPDPPLARGTGTPRRALSAPANFRAALRHFCPLNRCPSFQRCPNFQSTQGRC